MRTNELAHADALMFCFPAVSVCVCVCVCVRVSVIIASHWRGNVIMLRARTPAGCQLTAVGSGCTQLSCSLQVHWIPSFMPN